jgi:hypothetical protein
LNRGGPMGGGWEDGGSPAQHVNGKAVSGDRWLFTMAWTSGCWSRTWGWYALGNNKEACGAVGRLRGGQTTVVDGNPLAEEEAAKGAVLLGAVAGGLSSKVLLHLQWKMAVRFLGSDGDIVGWGGARRRVG